MPVDKKNAAAAPVNNLDAEAKEEEELQGSLSRLEGMLGQLEVIRGAMKTMLHPLHATAADPELVYAAFADAAQKTVREVREFQTAMRDDKMKELLKRGKEWAIKPENGNLWIRGFADGRHTDEDTSAVVNGLDTVKLERSNTPKKG